MVGLGLLILRIATGTALLAHGAHELFGLFAGPGVGPGGLHDSAAHFNSIGLTPGPAIAILAGGIQLVGGALILFGALTRAASVLAIGYLGMEVWKGQAQWGYFLNWTGDVSRGHGMEYSLALLAMLTCLALVGAGEWSFDERRSQTRAARAAGRARLRGHG